MNFLEHEYSRTRGKQPREEARRALLETCLAVLEAGDRILAKFKTTEAIDEAIDRMIAGGTKPAPWKDLYEIAGSVDALDEHLADARRAEAKRKAREEKRALVAATKAKPAPAPRPKKTPIPKVIKDEIWDYYVGNTVASTVCPCCQKSKITMRDFVAGHVLAEKHGGGITCENLVPICNKCNSSMGARHMVEFTMKHWGRPPVTPRNAVIFTAPTSAPEAPTPPPVAEDRISHEQSPPTWKYYKHARILSGSHDDAGRFACDDDALAYATSKGYKSITHKSGGLAMYYFSFRTCKKPRIAKSMEEPGWEYDSWQWK